MNNKVKLVLIAALSILTIETVVFSVLVGWWLAPFMIGTVVVTIASSIRRI